MSAHLVGREDVLDALPEIENVATGIVTVAVMVKFPAAKPFTPNHQVPEAGLVAEQVSLPDEVNGRQMYVVDVGFTLNCV